MKRFIPILLISLCFTSNVNADALPPTDVDMATVLRLARERSPRLAIERYGIDLAQAQRTTAGAYPNPTVSYGRFRPGGGASTVFEGSQQKQATLDVPLLIAGQRGARIEAAERSIEAAQAKTTAAGNDLALEVGVAFIQLLAVQEKVQVLTTALEDLSRLRDIVAARQANGLASQYDLARMNIELSGWQTRLTGAQADLASASNTLALLLGVRDWHPHAVGELRPLILSTASSTPEVANPTAIAALREEDAARAEIKTAQRERWPVPSMSVGRTWTSDPYGAANFLGISIEVPIFDSRRGALQKAKAEAQIATLKRTLIQAEVAGALERYSKIVDLRQQALNDFEQSAGRGLSTLRQMAEDAYRLGRGSVLELLDATRSRQELQLTRLELLSSLIEAQLRLLAVRGEVERITSSSLPN